MKSVISPFLRDCRISRNIFNKGTRVFLYGAGNYAKLYMRLCEIFSWSVFGLIISNDAKMENNTICKYQVYRLRNIRLKNDDIVILALNEKYHNNVVFQQGMRHVQTIAFANRFFEEIRTFLVIMEAELSIKSLHWYEKAEKIVCNMYRTIKISEVLISRFGPLLNFYIQREMDGEEKESLYVYIPMSWDFYGKPSYMEESSSANPYFYSRLQKRYYFLNKVRSKFWRWFFLRNLDMIDVTNRYSVAEQINHQDDYCKDGCLVSNKVFYNLNLHDFREGQKKQAAMGIRKPYVCFCARQPAYFEKMVGHADLPEMRQRCCNIDNFHLMAKELNKRKYQVVRMGKMAEGCIKGKNIIDYARLYYDDMMDFYLPSECEFIICQLSGFHLLSVLFNKPTLITDSILLSTRGDFVDICNPKHDLLLVKKIYSYEDNKFLTLREMLSIEERYPNLFDLTKYYHEHHYVFVDNTAAEICDAAIEMLNKVRGQQTYSDVELKLQEKFRVCLRESGHRSGNFIFDIPMSISFLKNNQWWLD